LTERRLQRQFGAETSAKRIRRLCAEKWISSVAGCGIPSRSEAAGGVTVSKTVTEIHGVSKAPGKDWLLREDSNPRENVNTTTYSAADGMFGSVFNIERCERHGKRHGAIELETHLQKRRLVRTSGVCRDSLWFRGNFVKSTAPIASCGAQSKDWKVLLHPNCTLKMKSIFVCVTLLNGVA